MSPHIRNPREYTQHDELMDLYPEDLSDYDSDDEGQHDEEYYADKGYSVPHLIRPQDHDLMTTISFKASQNIHIYDVRKKKTYLQAYIDTEYQEDIGISIQCRYLGMLGGFQVGGSFMIIDEQYKSFITPETINVLRSKYDAPIYYYNISGNLEEPVLLQHILMDLQLESNITFESKGLEAIKIPLRLFFFYSFTDLTITFGRNTMRHIYKDPKSSVSSKNNINGKFSSTFIYKQRCFDFKVRLADMSGLQSEPLKDIATACGFDTSLKTSLDPYKACMSQALKEQPVLFCEYGMNDCHLLWAIIHKKVSIFNSLIVDQYKINDSSALFTIHTLPLTIGSIVNQIFQIYLRYVVFQNNDAYRAAAFKQGYLNPTATHYKDHKLSIGDIQCLFTIEEFEKFKREKPEAFNRISKSLEDRDALLYDCMQLASAKHIVDQSVNDNLITSALVSGGRTLNERPNEWLIRFGADIDLAMAYGSQLRKLHLPIGRPNRYTTSFNQTKTITLGQFMKKNEHNLQRGMYKIIVSGTLSFEQDLISSRIIAPEILSKRTKSFGVAEFSSNCTTVPIVMLRNQIIYGTVTAPIWKILTTFCTSQELNEFKLLKVDSAVYWLDSNRVESIKELSEEFLKDKGTNSFDGITNRTTDTRTFKWFSVDLEDFIGVLADKRAELKADKNNPIAQASQYHYKLIINTFWGVISSVFFKINNVVCSEIVTSAIKCQIWMINKALNTVLSITDGGPYSLENVAFLKDNERRPGMDVLSNYEKYKRHRGVEFGPLGGLDWKSMFEKNVNPYEMGNLDKLAKDHIDDFCKSYSIRFQSNIEHKMDQTFLHCSYIGKAHYMFMTYDKEKKDYSKIYYKIRGFRPDDRVEFSNPVYDLLLFIIQNDGKKKDLFYIPNNFNYQVIKTIRLHGWRIAQRKTVSPLDPVYFKSHEEILPGDTVRYEFTYRLNNGHTHIKTVKEYNQRTRRSQKKVKYLINGQEAETRCVLFERYLNTEGLKITLIKLNKNDLERFSIKGATKTPKPRK
jgi:hypothetical protein